MIHFNVVLGGKEAELPWYRKAISLLIIWIEDSNRLYWSIYSSLDNLISRFTNIICDIFLSDKLNLFSRSCKCVLFQAKKKLFSSFISASLISYNCPNQIKYRQKNLVKFHHRQK